MIRLFILFLSFLTACGNYADYSNIKVVQVVDGDTVRLENGSLLRYIGIDTPERGEMGTVSYRSDPAPFAEKAYQRNQELVLGKIIRVEFDVEKKDKYNRLLGYCYRDDIFINELLVEEGLAIVYTHPPNVKHSDTFYQAQKKAREKQNGLWQGYQVVDHDQAGNYINQIQTVRGRVVSGYQSNNCQFLNFGKNHKTDFTIVIFKDSFAKFKEKSIDLNKYYLGKQVEVTGRIRQYNGPEIIVNSPLEITIIPESN